MAEQVTSLGSSTSSLKATGERFLPEQMHGIIELEHLHRYCFAGQFVIDKDVLDIACGEGYGSAYLAKFARRVYGVDISNDAVTHANLKYVKNNLKYCLGTCSSIPLEDNSIDIVVSFETIEHHDEHEAMIQEIKRVLRPSGILVISSPDKFEYSDKLDFHNDFHVKELYREEFESLLAEYFKNVNLYGQRVMLGSALFGQVGSKEVVFQKIGSDSATVKYIPEPLYWVAVASNEKLPEVSCGVFEQPIGDLLLDIERVNNKKITELINAIATPDSTLLKEQLLSSWYLQKNPDILAAGFDAYEHWVNNGMAEGRLPAPDSVKFIQNLVSERESSLNANINVKERELRSIQQETIERERAFGEQLNQLQQAASQEHVAQVAAVQEQISALAKQHAEREESLRLAIEEKESEIRQVRYELIEQQRMLNSEIAQTRLKARYELDAQLRALAERERAFGEQLTQLQQAANQERVAQVAAVQEQMSALAKQHAEREESLRLAIEEKESEIRQVRYELIEQQRVLNSEIAQTRLKARDEVNAQLRTLAERERAFGEQLTQLQQAASQERVAQVAAVQEQMSALAKQHAGREESLRLAIENKENEIRHIRYVSVETNNELTQRLLDQQINATQLNSKLKYQYTNHLFELNSKLVGIKTTLSWRLTTPLRVIAGLFGSKNEFNHIEYSELSGLSAAEVKGQDSINTKNYLITPSMSIGMVKGVQEMPSKNISKIITSVKTLNEMLDYDSEAFVTCVYLTLLGRAPDPEGFAYYLEHLKANGNKLEIIYDIYCSQEAIQFNSDIVGLNVAMNRKKLEKIPLIGYFLRSYSRDLIDQRVVNSLNSIDKQVEVLGVNLSALATEVSCLQQVSSNNCMGGSFEDKIKSFNPDYYLEMNSDVAKSGINPYEHYFSYGYSEGRLASPNINGQVEESILSEFKSGIFEPVENIVPEELMYSEVPKNSKVNIIAFYLPQFHPIPENDKWWGKGFTEWTNVTRAQPFYIGHDQPRLPGELGFYDLRNIEVIKRQAELAQIHGIYGFCFYIYWFAGHRLLETPVNLLLRHPEVNINFCYCWANENWTRRWDGLEDDVLIGQSHSAQDDIDFILNMAHAFNDKRYIRINGKPVLIIYRPALLPNCHDTVSRWREWCLVNGFGEIYVCCSESFGQDDPRKYGLDASIEFPPLTNGPHLEVTDKAVINNSNFMGKIYSYSCAAENSKMYKRPDWVQYRAVMPSWDNTARKMERGFSFAGASPDIYADWLEETVIETVASNKEGNRFVFINAWNEWAEGAYLEPDRRRGYAYLNRTREVISKFSERVVNDRDLLAKTAKSNNIAVIIHLHYVELFDVIASYLDNIDGGADLYFSVRDGGWAIAKDLILAKFPTAIVVSYPNHGRDIFPFLQIFSHIRDFGYQAICKIHSKKSKHRGDGDKWRDDVFNKLLGCKDIIKSCIEKIDQGAGVVAPSGHCLDSSNYWGSNAKRVTELAQKIGCSQVCIDHFYFPAGSMFWFASKAMTPLMDLNLKFDDFEIEAGQVDGTTAHAVERLFGLSAMKSGLSIEESFGDFSWNEGRYPFADKT